MPCDEIYQAAAAPDALRKNRRRIGTRGMDRRSVGGDGHGASVAGAARDKALGDGPIEIWGV